MIIWAEKTLDVWAQWTNLTKAQFLHSGNERSIIQVHWEDLVRCSLLKADIYWAHTMRQHLINLLRYVCWTKHQDTESLGTLPKTESGFKPEQVCLVLTPCSWPWLMRHHLDGWDVSFKLPFTPDLGMGSGTGFLEKSVISVNLIYML